MFQLDMRTVIITHLVVNGVCAAVLFSLWRQNRQRFTGCGWWFLDYVLQTGAVLLVALRGAIPDFISMVVANTLVVAGALAVYRGLELFVGRPSSQRFNLVHLGLFPLVHAYFLYVEPNLAARTLNLTFALLSICGQCAWALFHSPAAMRPITRNVARVFAVLALLNGLRFGVTLATLPPDNDFFHSGAFDTSCVMGYQVLHILLAYTLALMVNRRLLGGIQAQEEKFTKAFHSAPYAIVIAQFSNGRILDVNRGFSSLTGYEPAEAIGRSTGELELWADETDRERAIARLTEQHGSLAGEEIVFRRKSGELWTGLCSSEIITLDGRQCLISSVTDISARKAAENEKSQLIDELHATLDKIKRLEGMLPICMYCKKIRDDHDHWQRVEDYIRSRSEADFSHGICPECFEREHGDLARRHGIDPAKLPGTGTPTGHQA